QSYRITGNQELINSAKYVADNEGNYFYWGRRGPSVHLSYTTPADKDIEYCYNEITVPEGEDVVGSYYMANGFGEGYFGIQVNSATERRILFSVWSPFHTDNPKEIPDDEKILLTAKGADVIRASLAMKVQADNRSCAITGLREIPISFCYEAARLLTIIRNIRLWYLLRKKAIGSLLHRSNALKPIHI